MPAPNVEARLSEEELAEIRATARYSAICSGPCKGRIGKLLHELDAVRRERDEARTERDMLAAANRDNADAAQKEIAELRGERDAAKARILDLKITLKGIEKTLPELQAKVLEDCQVEIAVLKQEAQHRGFAQGVAAVRQAVLDEGKEWESDSDADDALTGVLVRIAKLQPPPERTPAAPPVSEYERGRRDGFAEGRDKAVVAAATALGLSNISTDDVLRADVLGAIRSLKGKPAGAVCPHPASSQWLDNDGEWHCTSCGGKPAGPAGGEGGA